MPEPWLQGFTRVPPPLGTDRGGRLALWNLRVFKRVHSISAPEAWPVTCLAFEPGGRWLAAASSDGFVRLHDLGSRTLLQSFQVRACRAAALLQGSRRSSFSSA